MPAPQASAMQQLARLKFSSFNLKVPQNWKEPSGDPAAKHYGDAFKPAEKSTAPAVSAPPLFKPASMNKYHTDAQKMHIDKIGKFIDGIVQRDLLGVEPVADRRDDGRCRDQRGRPRSAVRSSARRGRR